RRAQIARHDLARRVLCAARGAALSRGAGLHGDCLRRVPDRGTQPDRLARADLGAVLLRQLSLRSLQRRPRHGDDAVHPFLVAVDRRAVLHFLSGAGAVAARAAGIGGGRHPELLDTEYFYLRTELRIDSIAFGVLAASLCELPRGRALIRFLIRPLPVAAA